MLERLVAGETDPAVLADIAVGRLQAKYDALMPASQGLMGAHQRFLLAQLLGRIDELTTRIASLDEEIVRRVDPQEATIRLLCTMPSISRRTAEVIVAELRTDMGRGWRPAKKKVRGYASGLCAKCSSWLRGRTVTPRAPSWGRCIAGGSAACP